MNFYITKRSVLRIRQMHFGTLQQALDCDNADVTYCKSIDKDYFFDVRQKHLLVQKQHTLVTELAENEDAIFKKITKNCKYDIRRAEKDGIESRVYDALDSESDFQMLKGFQKCYNQMFSSKGMANKFNWNMVVNGLKNGQMVVTTNVLLNNPSVVVYHAYSLDEKNCCLELSTSPILASEDKDLINIIGRMNKNLHWKDILFFKAKGIESLNWGGIKSFDNPDGISKFKMEFGGRHEIYCNYIVGHSFLGRIYKFLCSRRINGIVKK